MLPGFFSDNKEEIISRLTDTRLCGVWVPLEFSRSNFFALELSRINLNTKQILIDIFISENDFFLKK